MRVLWLCNIVMPELAGIFGFKKQNVGGWLVGAWEELKKTNDIELGLCVPVRNPSRVKDGVVNGYNYYSFLMVSDEFCITIDSQIERFKVIIESFKPDIVHVWGTEYEHAYSMVQACKALNIIDRVLVNIQGLLTYCNKVYSDGIPEDIINKNINNKSIKTERKFFEKGSELEKTLIADVKNVVGRTDWDKACVFDMNPAINYYYCGEILRQGFYNSPKWSYDKCVHYRIFISQASYPLKGLHMVIEYLAKLRQKWADMEIVIAGEDVTKKQTGYGDYLIHLIETYGMKNEIHFVGVLDEDEMIRQYLSANIFLSASLMENSSNSVSEAMMIGTPVVASFVGGIPSVIQHGKSGLMYPVNEAYVMAHYIDELFGNPVKAETISKNEIVRAEAYNNKRMNGDTLINIYMQMRNKS